MQKIRVIPRLDIKGPNVVKGIHLEGLRVVGNPAEFAKRYYEQGADEILYIDIVASLYERNSLVELIKETNSKGVFVPLTVGGGIRSLNDIKEILRAGADKVAINTAAIKNPSLIAQAAKRFGSQCIVGAIDAKYRGDAGWEAYFDNGRERTGLDAIEWAKKMAELGVGEMMVTSIDREGTGAGFELGLVKRMVEVVDVPVIAGGGAGDPGHITECFRETGCQAVSVASILHYGRTTIPEIKEHLLSHGVLNVRAKSAECGAPAMRKEKKEKTVSIVDYGMGNLYSVISALKELGYGHRLVATPEEILASDSVILPGVGAFGDAMEELSKRGLVEAIRKHADMGKPLLGICLGMQLLLSESEEFGLHKGLDIIHGHVVRLEPDESARLPHINWDEIMPPNGAGWSGTILDGIPPNSSFYFVHSFGCFPEDINNFLATTVYGGQPFCSVARKGNVYGTQFHPEKSGSIGLKLLESFLRL